MSHVDRRKDEGTVEQPSVRAKRGWEHHLNAFFLIKYKGGIIKLKVKTSLAKSHLSKET